MLSDSAGPTVLFLILALLFMTALGLCMLGIAYTLFKCARMSPKANDRSWFFIPVMDPDHHWVSQAVDWCLWWSVWFLLFWNIGQFAAMLSMAHESVIIELVSFSMLFWGRLLSVTAGVGTIAAFLVTYGFSMFTGYMVHWTRPVDLPEFYSLQELWNFWMHDVEPKDSPSS